MNDTGKEAKRIRRNPLRKIRLDLPRQVYALFFVRLVVSAGSFVQPFLAMTLTIKLGWEETAAGAFMGILSVLSVSGLLLGGRLGDTIGRRKTLALLQLLTAAGYIMCALSNFSAYVPFVIAFSACALSGTYPVINAVVADVVPQERRKEAFSLIYWGNNVGFSLGPLAAGFLFNTAPSLMFAGNALAILIAAGIVLFVIQETNPKAKEASAGSFPRTEAPAEEKKGTLRVFLRNPMLSLFAVLNLVIAFVYSQQSFALPIFLRDVLGTASGPKTFGMAMTSNGLTVVAFTAFVALFSRKLSALACIALSCLLYALGFGAYGFSASAAGVIACTMVWTLGEILGATNTNAFIAEHAPPLYRSRVNSVISISYIGGNALAPLVSGALIRSIGSRAVWLPIAITACAAAVFTVGLRIFERTRKRG